MDTNEDLFCALCFTLQSSLVIITNDIPHWYYGILLDASSTSSLSYLLGLSLDELVNILKVCGLLNTNKAGVYSVRTSQTIKSSTYSWGELLNDAQLESNYFEKMQVNHINDLKTAPKKQMWWLGIGHNERYTPTNYNPSTQFHGFITGAPKLDDSVKVIVAACSTRMKEITKLVVTEDYSEGFSRNINDITCSELHEDVTKKNHISETCLNTVNSLSMSISVCDRKLEVEKRSMN